MYLDNGAIKLAENKWENLLQHNKGFLQIDFLQDDGKYVHGGNGIVFKLTDEQENQDYVIKFSKFPEQKRVNDWRIEKRLKRFEREIEALSVYSGQIDPPFRLIDPLAGGIIPEGQPKNGLQ